MLIRTRFAPSPTGDLHVGSVRTALYCYLYAKRHGGKFILRIEDTDTERSTPAAVKVILDGMQWLGLSCDEGPFYQTQHFARYQEVIQQLLSTGHAYRCTCSKERLEEMRTAQQENHQKPRYDGHCRDLNLPQMDTPFVIRFKNPLAGEVVIHDLILGDVVIKNEELDDLIIARTDGTPTYNFTVVVDDWDMGVTHVIRGNDHLNNTPRQINMLHALGAKLPEYAHLPMILGEDGKKLSKRHGAVSVLHYQEEGYLPQALLNYLVRLGWAHGDQEVFSLDEMIQYFDIKDVNKAASAFNMSKLQWLNQHYMKTLPAEEVAEHLAFHMQALGIDVTQGPSLTELVKAQSERSHTLREIALKSRYFYEEFENYDEQSAAKNLTAEALPPLQCFLAKVSELTAWEREKLHDVVKAVAEEMGLGMGKVAQPIRVAVTGSTVSPSIDVTLELLGQKKVIARLQRAIDYIS